MALCECGCGGEAEPGNRYIRGHNNRGIKASKETIQKQREAKKVNKEIREGKRQAPRLPFCACGCGGRVAKLGNKYIAGHHLRGKKPWNYGETKETDDRVKKYGEKGGKTLKTFYTTEEGKEYAKERSENLKVFYQTEEGKKVAKEHSIFLKSFFETEEGQKWLDKYWRGENSPLYGKYLTEEHKQHLRDSSPHISGKDHHMYGRTGEKAPMYGKYHTDEAKQKISETRIEKFANGELKNWSEGLTKETSESVARGAETLSISKQEFFATEEGQEWLDKHNRGENCPAYGKPSWSAGKTKDMSESLMRISESKKGDKNPSKRPEVRQKISEKQIKNWQDPEFVKMMVNSWYRSGQTRPEKETDGIVHQLYPNEYKFNGNFELGITIGGKIPDFVNVNGKKKAIDVFGDWCHRDDDPQVRIDLFKEYGWDLLVIWQHELKDKDAVIQKIVKFHGVKSDYVLTQKTLDTWVDGEDKNENQQT